MRVKKLAVLGPAVAVLIAAGLGTVHLLGSRSSADAVTAPAYSRPATAAEEALLQRAEERLIGRCMSEHDFVYRERPAPKAADNKFPYVVDDVAFAKKHGYGLTAQDSKPEQPGTDEAFSRLSTADQRSYQDKLVGTGRQITVDLPGGGRLSVSDKGCIATARKALYGDLRGWFSAAKTVGMVDRVVTHDVRADPQYEAAVKDWAACVRRTVPGVTDEGGLREELDRRTKDLPDAPAQRVQVQLAVVEATCANSSSLARTIRAIEPVHRAAVVAKYQDDQRRLYAYEVAALPRAHAALG
jgi:hypothetical protein